MKCYLLFFFSLIFFHSKGQINSVMPPEAVSFYNNTMQKMNPEFKNAIEKNANKLKGRRVNMDSLTSELGKDSFFKKSRFGDLHAIAILIMVQISKDADADLKNLVVNMHQKEVANASEISEKIIATKRQIAENVSSVIHKFPGLRATLSGDPK